MPESDASAEVTAVLTAWLDMAGAVGGLKVGAGASTAAMPANVRAAGRLVAVVHDRQVLAWIEDGPRGIRQLTAALGAEWDAHVPVNGACPQCQVPAPCRSRTRLTTMLVADAVQKQRAVQRPT